MNRYEKGKIYKVVDLDFNKCYTGSTTEPFKQKNGATQALIPTL